MPPALTPALALQYVRELSADVRTGVVLDAAGDVLAGPRDLAGGARAFLAAAGGAAEVEAVRPAGVVCAVRSVDRAAVAVCGRFALAGVVRQDLRVALAALEGVSPPPGPARTGDQGGSDRGDSVLESAADALIFAAQRHFEG